jgi:predicted secreted protein
MSWISVAAIYFIIWWLVLFATLPFSLKTQDDEGETVLGTVSSAPQGPHMLRAILRTTVVSLLIFGALYVLTRVIGLGIDDIPRFIPEYN